MLGDSLNAALEEQEKNKTKIKQREREKNRHKKELNNKSNSKINKTNDNIIIPGDSNPLDSEINIIENTSNKTNISINSKKTNPQINIKSNISKNTPKKDLKINKNIANNIYSNDQNLNQEYFQTKKKKIIPLPKSNNSNNNKYSSKSPDNTQNHKRKREISKSPDNNYHHKKSNSINNNISEISKEEITKRIKESILDVDQRYLNPSFNLMSEIINVFGDINFEKVKQDINRLKSVNTKLDDIIKLLVDKHSEEFFQILGYVRETKNIIEASKIKYDYAQVSLNNLTSNVSNLVINENKDWKLQSIFLNEIITRLSKTLHIFEILHECEEYIRNDKLLDAMNIINTSKEEHLNYDKEFRNYNLLVTINIRFIHIQKEINLKIITGLNQVIFFDEFKVRDEFYKEHKEKEVFVPLTEVINDDSNSKNDTNDISNNSENLNNNENNILYKKVNSLINYFVNYFSKISIDTEIVKPINKFINIIEKVVNYKLEEEIGLKFVSDIDINASNNINKVNYALNKRNTETLIYYIKCLREYNDESLLKLLNILIETINSSLNNFLCKTVDIINEKLKLILPLLSKFNLEEKNEKIKFLLFLQILVLILMHSLIKMNTLIKYVIKNNKNIKSFFVENLEEIKENKDKNMENNNIYVNSKEFRAITNKIYSAYEKCFIMILLTFYKNIIQKSELTEGDTGNVNLSSNHSFHDFSDFEALLKRKINEMNFLNFEHLSILYKIIDEMYNVCKNRYNINFKDLKKYLVSGTSTLFKYYSNKLYVNKFFDLASFTNDYDSSLNNFKFFEELSNKLEILKKLYIFALDVGYKEIMKILRQLLMKYYDDQKTFLTKLQKDCIHRQLYKNLWDHLSKNKINEDLLNTLIINYQFRKYSKNSESLDSTIKSKIKNKNINTNISTSTKNSNDEKNFSDVFKKLSINFIFEIIKATKPSDQLILLTRNYKLLELLTKFLISNESICLMIENFIFDLMNNQFENAKIIALMEQLKSVKLENMLNNENLDLSSLIIISISTLDNISQEKLKMLLLLKVEYICLMIPLARNLTRNNYYLNEPQMTPEYFVVSFINDLTMYVNLFQYGLEPELCNFIMEDTLLIINNIFIETINNMSNSINSYGANLLIRDFEYIKDNFQYDTRFYVDDNENNKFIRSVFYCVNYIKLLTVNDNKINELVDIYFQVIPFDKNFVKPIFELKKISRKNNQVNENNQIARDNFMYNINNNEDEDDYNSFL